jgi:hypothetical protein
LSALFPVPRTHHASSTQRLTQSWVGTTFNVYGADFFVTTSDGTTAPYGTIESALAVDASISYFNPDIASTTATNASLITKTTIKSLYEYSGQSFTTVPQMVRIFFDSPIYILGLIETEFDVGFASNLFSQDNYTSGGSVGRGRGIRAIWSFSSIKAKAHGTFVSCLFIRFVTPFFISSIYFPLVQFNLFFSLASVSVPR